MEDYESVKRQALKFIHENKKELSKNYADADICGNPVDASHFFSLIDKKSLAMTCFWKCWTMR